MKIRAALATMGLVAACRNQPPAAPGEATGPSAAYGIWTPGPNDTCTPEIHNRYAVVGADGKLYPTWHPPVDPETGCTFGHEHGRDPRGSNLYGTVGPIPFGFASEQLDIWDPAGGRHEDHVGHKIEWENGIRLSFGGSVTGALLELRCDVLTQLHQGTHSGEAFTDNLHELAYHIRCEDGTQVHVTLMSAIGRPGEFARSCDPDQIVMAGPATPANSPEGDGRRAIPDRACVEQYAFVPQGETGDFRQALRESWETSNVIRSAEGRTLAFFNPFFQVELPSRYFDPAQPDHLARSIDICYETLGDGFRARGEPCDVSTGGGVLLNVTYDDARSAFDGATRTVDINDNEIRNEDGPDVWYTDPFGRNGRVTPFPGSIRQFIAKINNDRGIGMSGAALGRGYGGNGVHPPN